MEKERRYYASRLEDEVRTLEGYVKQNKATIQRFRADTGGDAIAQRIRTLKAKVADQEQQIKEKLNKAEEIRVGLHDDELKRETAKVHKETQKRHNETMRIKREKQQEKARRRQESDRIYHRQRQQDRSDRQRQRDYKYEYRRFLKICDSIPDYIERNLRDMPHNKGYVWRGVWLFGKKPEEPGKPQVMFERKNKDLLIIHESDAHEIRRYEKRGKNRKVLVERRARRRIAGAPVNGEFR